MTDSLDTDLQGELVEPVVSEGVPVSNADNVLDKATVSKIVARERSKAYEKGKQEARMELEQQQAPAQALQQAQAAPSTFGGMPQMNHEDIQRMIAEQVPQYLQQQATDFHNKQFVDSFVSKMQAAEQHHPGLETKLNDLDYSQPGTMKLLQMANNLENTGAIMNELIENPEKMGSILTLLHEQPKLAQQKLASLSNSIKVNQEAMNQDKSAQQPIGQMKSSVNAGVDDHNLSVKDLKKMFSSKR